MMLPLTGLYVMLVGRAGMVLVARPGGTPQIRVLLFGACHMDVDVAVCVQAPEKERQSSELRWQAQALQSVA